MLQAMVGGILLDNDGSLARVVREKLPFYRANRPARRRRLAGLDRDRARPGPLTRLVRIGTG